MSIRLILADDHSLVLESLRVLLGLEPDLIVTMSCVDGLEVMEAVREDPPDVLVMDMVMPHSDGIETHERLREEGLRVPTVMLAASFDDRTLARCLEASVEGLVLKESAASVLIEAVRAVAAGDRWVPREFTARAAELSAREPVLDDLLTARELEVVRAVAAGSSNKRVASALGISHRTVKLHLHSAYGKLAVSNRVQLSLVARDRGWI